MNPCLRYSAPAEHLLFQGLPLGDGLLGALVAGGVGAEVISFTHKDLWSGGPGADPKWNFGIRNGVAPSMRRLRALLLRGATDYALKFPAYRGPPPGARASKMLNAVRSSSYTALRKRHALDVKAHLGRVAFSLRGSD